jgi:hypothetical protein
VTAQAQVNKLEYSYNLAAGATSAPIAIPAPNVPVSIIGVNTTLHNRGVGQATIMHVHTSASDAFLEWVGMDIVTAQNSNPVPSGYTSIAGAHIIFLDNNGAVDIQVADANHIQIHNTGVYGPQKGNITFIW